jgi:hypothetical protein
MFRPQALLTRVGGKSLLSAVWLAGALLTTGCPPPNATTVVENTEDFRRRLEKEITAEIRTGICSSEHHHELERALEKVNTTFTQRTEYAGFKFSGGQYVVAKETGVTIALDAGLGGEYHIFAYGFAPITVTAEDEQGNVIETPSNRAHLAGAPGEVPASLQLSQSRGTYLITVKGRGCAAVAAFKRVY